MVIKGNPKSESNLETSLLRPPEIINPYNLCVRSSQDSTFVTDLGLETLLGFVPFVSDTRDLATKVIVDLNSDNQTVNYRQEALEELIKNPQVRTDLKRLVKSLAELDLKRYNVSIFGVIRTYRRVMLNLPDLESAQSEVISSANRYLKAVRDSEEFSRLSELVDKADNLVNVDLRVSFSKDKNPVHISVLELVGKQEKPRRSFFERISAQNKSNDGEENLLSSYELDHLRVNIKHYLDREISYVCKGFLPQINEVIGFMKQLDFYVGFADYFVKLREQGFDICRPILLPKEKRRMKVEKARNPLLMEAKNNGKKVVPNEIEYDGENNVFVITGPNNGGKTTYVKTVGLVQLLAQSGLFVPAKSAEVSFTDGIYTHFIATDDITKGEGRYRNELRRMKEIFERATPYSLVILDEPCGGTSYEEGQRQSLVLLDGFHTLASATYFTTHMHPLTKEVENGRYPAGKNIQVECVDKGGKLGYTYRVIPGSSGKSYGEEIAREIGLGSEEITNIISKRANKMEYRKLLRE